MCTPPRSQSSRRPESSASRVVASRAYSRPVRTVQSNTAHRCKLGKLEVPEDQARIAVNSGSRGGGAPVAKRPDVRWVSGEYTFGCWRGRWVLPGLAQFLAVSNLKAEWQRRGQVLAGGPLIVRHIAVAAVGQRLHDRVVHPRVGNHQVTARSESPRELGEHRSQLWHVGQRECADHQVDVLIGYWELTQISVAEIAGRHFRGGHGQHAG